MAKTMDQHRSVLADALIIYEERLQVRGDHWAGPEFDVIDPLYQIKNKIGRCEEALKLGGEAAKMATIEEALDIINYAAFMVRHLRGWYGEAR